MTAITESILSPLDNFRAGRPGIYPGIGFVDYLRLPILSQSTLKEGRNSMAHLRAALDNERIREQTDDMTLGSALHVCFLEPEEMPAKVALWEGGRRYGKEWDAFCEEHDGKYILTVAYHQKLVGMVKSLRKHPCVRQWLGKIEHVEVSAIGAIQSVPFKCRADALTEDPLWDLKKTNKADDRSINNTIYQFGYHIQAYIYKKIFGRDRFCLGFVEDMPPFDVRVVELSDAWMKIGKSEAVGLVQAYEHCLKTGKWPGRSDQIETLEPPTWLSEQNDAAAITIGGESAFGG